MKPPFPYFGGKMTIAPRIVDLLPPHQHYIEPFAGSMSVLLAKPPVKFETVNDLDGRLITFWRVLREQPAELIRRCALTPHSRGPEIRKTHPYLADPAMAPRYGDPPCTCGMPKGWRGHAEPDIDPQAAVIDARILGETQDQHQEEQ